MLVGPVRKHDALVRKHDALPSPTVRAAQASLIGRCGAMSLPQHPPRIVAMRRSHCTKLAARRNHAHDRHGQRGDDDFKRHGAPMTHPTRGIFAGSTQHIWC